MEGVWTLNLNVLGVCVLCCLREKRISIEFVRKTSCFFRVKWRTLILVILLLFYKFVYTLPVWRGDENAFEERCWSSWVNYFRFGPHVTLKVLCGGNSHFRYGQNPWLGYDCVLGFFCWFLVYIERERERGWGWKVSEWWWETIIKIRFRLRFWERVCVFFLMIFVKKKNTPCVLSIHPERDPFFYSWNRRV